MIEGLKSWIITILISAFIVNIVDMMLPDSKLKPYINLVINFIFVFMVITPIINLFSNNISFEDKILSTISGYNKEYAESAEQLAIKSGADKLASGYEEGLKFIEHFNQTYQKDLKVIWISEKPLDSTSIKANSSTELYITTTSNLYNTLITK